jgi:hypothetical protein
VLIWTKHVNASATVSPYKNKSPLSQEPTSAVELHSQIYKTNSKHCTRSVAVPGNFFRLNKGRLAKISGQDTRCRAEISKCAGDHVILLLPVS